MLKPASIILACLIGTLQATATQAQSAYPQRDVTFVVPWNAGLRNTDPPIAADEPPDNLSEAVVRLEQQTDGTLAAKSFFIPYDVESRVQQLLKSLTLEEKVGQLIQADIDSIRPEDLDQFPVGSILAGGNAAPGKNVRSSADAWLNLTEAYLQTGQHHRVHHPRNTYRQVHHELQPLAVSLHQDHVPEFILDLQGDQRKQEQAP